jgi:Cys-tRNA(Pro) deacylase
MGCKGFSMADYPITPAVRFLRQAGVTFIPHLYDYVEHGGTAVSAASLGVPEHHVIKTLVFEDNQRKPLIVLMHGDRQVSAKELARVAGVKTVGPCAPETAEKHTGYKVGGTSPFGVRKPIPVYAEAAIRELPTLYINGGARGFLVGIAGELLEQLLAPTWVKVAR